MPKTSSSRKLPYLNEDKYRGQWVALNPKNRRVVAAGRSIKAAERAAARLGVTNPILHGVPKSDAYFAGLIWSLAMIFPYWELERGGRKRYQPIITVKLTGPAGELDIDALVDSGADGNIFSPEVAERLNIRYKHEKQVTIEGVGGAHTAGYLVPVEMHLNSHTWTAPVIFSKAVTHRGILGQEGFFKFFTVTFRYAKTEIDIRRLRNSPTA